MTIKDAIVPLCGLLLFAGVVYLAIQDADHWEKFKAEHHCRFAYSVPATAPPAVAKGKWVCDDGETYYN